jgi:hypothetical protein
VARERTVTRLATDARVLAPLAGFLDVGRTVDADGAPRVAQLPGGVGRESGRSVVTVEAEVLRDESRLGEQEDDEETHEEGRDPDARVAK